MALELNIPIRSFGSMTWRRQDVRAGLEPDEWFYVQNEPRVRGRTDLDPARDPPPDLAVEVDVTNAPPNRPGVYAALGVPELWRYDGRRSTAWLLDEAGQYRPSETSRAFPFLRPSELERFLAMLASADETTVMRSFRDWVRQFAGTP